MNRKTVISTIFISSLFLSSSLAFGQKVDVESLKLRIDSVNAILDEAAINQDYETIEKYFTDDVIRLPNNEPLIQGKKAFIENEKKAAQMGVKVVSIKSTLVELFASGNLIHEVGKYEITLDIKGVPFPITDKGKYLVIWQEQEDGSLKIKLETWNHDEEER